MSQGRVRGGWPRAVLAAVTLTGLAACSSNHHIAKPSGTSVPTTVVPESTTTTAPITTTTRPTKPLPTLSIQALPVPTQLVCPAGLYFLAPGNQAAGMCLPYAYLVGGTASDPNNNTACPAGSLMSMGPVVCSTDTGIVMPVPPGPDTCSSPGGPCPSSRQPLSSQMRVLDWSAVPFPATGKCPGGYYFGETNGVATCVPYDYLPGGVPANPNKNTLCPIGSNLARGTLCTREAPPYGIVAPVSASSS